MTDTVNLKKLLKFTDLVLTRRLDQYEDLSWDYHEIGMAREIDATDDDDSRLVYLNRFTEAVDSLNSEPDELHVRTLARLLAETSLGWASTIYYFKCYPAFGEESESSINYFSALKAETEKMLSRS